MTFHKAMRWICVAILGLVLSGVAAAEEYHWTNAGGDLLWSNTDNWLIPDGGGGYEVPSESPDGVVLWDAQTPAGQGVSLLDESAAIAGLTGRYGQDVLLTRPPATSYVLGDGATDLRVTCDTTQTLQLDVPIQAGDDGTGKDVVFQFDQAGTIQLDQPISSSSSGTAGAMVFRGAGKAVLNADNSGWVDADPSQAVIRVEDLGGGQVHLVVNHADALGGSGGLTLASSADGKIGLGTDVTLGGPLRLDAGSMLRASVDSGDTDRTLTVIHPDLTTRNLLTIGDSQTTQKLVVGNTGGVSGVPTVVFGTDGTGGSEGHVNLGAPIEVEAGQAVVFRAEHDGVRLYGNDSVADGLGRADVSGAGKIVCEGGGYQMIWVNSTLSVTGGMEIMPGARVRPTDRYGSGGWGTLPPTNTITMWNGGGINLGGSTQTIEHLTGGSHTNASAISGGAGDLTITGQIDITSIESGGITEIAKLKIGDDFGHIRFTETTVLNLDIAGTAPADYDHMTSGPQMHVDGTLALDIQNGFTPVLGDAWHVVRTYYTDYFHGTFDRVTGALFSADLALAVTYDYDTSDYDAGVKLRASIPGDVDFDGDVDIQDISMLASNWDMASGAVWADGDFDQDGGVDIEDLSLLASNWSTGVADGYGAPAVPEPGCLALVTLGGLAVIRRGLR